MVVFYIFKKLSEYMENIRKIQIEFLEVRTTKCEMKRTLDGTNDRSDIAEGKVGKLEAKTLEIIQGEMHKEKNIKGK